jgi:hypothetical protein
MDVLAHALWAGLGVAAMRTRRPIPTRTVAATVALAVLPDIVQLAPLLWRAAISGDVAVLRAYATALPGLEPALSPSAAFWTHHLHCVMHSAPIAALVTLISCLVLRRLWIPMLGWWSHIVIDVFTHSTAFYPVPVFYPFSDWAFDGLLGTGRGFSPPTTSRSARRRCCWCAVRKHAVCRLSKMAQTVNRRWPTAPC